MDLATFITSVGAVVVTLAAAAGGGVFGAFVAARALKEATARSLLSDALQIQAQKEAWILEGSDYSNQSLSRIEGAQLSTNHEGGAQWLRAVEVRAVLDGAPWCTPDSPKHCFGFVAGRRAWVVRDKLTANPNEGYTDASPGDAHPALLSSQGFEELAAWIEQVASARVGWSVLGFTFGRTLSNAGLEMLRPLLQALATDDRIAVFQTGNQRLTDRAESFLREWQAEFIKRSAGRVPQRSDGT